MRRPVRVYISLLFTRKRWMIEMRTGRSSGLLSAEHLPVPRHSGLYFQQRGSYYCALKAYSYGDSAGFAPDFPFNGAEAPTNNGANVGKNW